MPYDAPVFSAAFAAVSAVAALFSYFISRRNLAENRRNLAAKLTDRLYDLDKMILDKACKYKGFMDEAVRELDNYFEVTSPSQTYYEYKAFAHFHLNLFDEIFGAYGSRSADFDAEWRAWRNYIFAGMKHSLIRETLLSTGGIGLYKERYVCRGSGIFDDRFVEFLCHNQEQWKDDFEKNTF